jgi:glycosyltransferase involved in cell wall biosynthesis
MMQKYGGVSRYFLELYKAINKIVNCKIIAPISIKSHTREINDNFYNLIKVNEIPSFGTKINNNLNYITSSIYMKYWKPNIIHKTYFNNHKYSFIDAKKILNVWDLTHEIYPELYNKSKDWRPKQKSLDLTDHVICSSYKTRDDLKKYYNFDLNKTSVVYQGINEEKKKKNILFISGDNSKLKNYYLNSTALIYPSKNEGFGFPPLEAMSFGCPVITSNNPAILEATDLSLYTFNPESPQDIALKLENIIYSKNSINHLIYHGLTRIKQLSWKKTSSQILEIYDNLLN